MYGQQPLPLRDHLITSHKAAVNNYREPGTWFDAKQRLAILSEIRATDGCQLCSNRKAALSPYHVEGKHDSCKQDVQLDDNVIEVIHRIKTDSGRITHKWFLSILNTGLRAEAYIELVGLIATNVILDSFATSLGVPLQTPDTTNLSATEPSMQTTDNVVEAGAWVKLMIVPEDNTSTGIPAIPNIARAMGIVPLAVQQFFSVMMSHYSLTRFETELSRMQNELIASRMSSYNDCFY